MVLKKVVEIQAIPNNGVVTMDNLLKGDIGKIFRHKRLFNYVVILNDVGEKTVSCLCGKNSFREFPLEYFVRDWKMDKSIESKDIQEKIQNFPNNTPFTVVYSQFFEKDDGEIKSYIHYNDDFSEQLVRFPKWYVSSYTKSQRDELINPFTMIMPVFHEKIDEVKADLEIINLIREENETISIDDFQGLEFGLIKYLEKKYLLDM